MSLAKGDEGTGPAADTVLSVDGLTVEFGSPDDSTTVVDDVSFDVRESQVLGVVGESGSGKSVTMLAALGLVTEIGGRVTSGRVRLRGQDLSSMTPRELRQIRGKEIGMIFQNPVRGLNPGLTVGQHLTETIRAHRRVGRRDARALATELLSRVRIDRPERRLDEYPHAFSGGMCQRVMIALALASEPRILIADEPTTALDTRVQAGILDLLREIQQEMALSVVLVSHDLGVIAEMCDRVAVMYAGQVVEEQEVGHLFQQPRHPYTAGLIQAVPTPGQGRTLLGIKGAAPDARSLPEGCRFHPRCNFYRVGECDSAPDLNASGDGTVRCHRHSDLSLRGVGQDDVAER